MYGKGIWNLQRVVERVSYKDWNFRIRNEDSIRLDIGVPTLDTRKSDLPPTYVTHSYPLLFSSEVDLDLPDSEWIKMIFECIIRTEKHESSEWFKVDGKAPYDPHDEHERPETTYVPKLVAYNHNYVGVS